MKSKIWVCRWMPKVIRHQNLPSSVCRRLIIVSWPITRVPSIRVNSHPLSGTVFNYQEGLWYRPGLVCRRQYWGLVLSLFPAEYVCRIFLEFLEPGPSLLFSLFLLHVFLLLHPQSHRSASASTVISVATTKGDSNIPPYCSFLHNMPFPLATRTGEGREARARVLFFSEVSRHLAT